MSAIPGRCLHERRRKGRRLQAVDIQRLELKRWNMCIQSRMAQREEGKMNDSERGVRQTVASLSSSAGRDDRSLSQCQEKELPET